MTPHELLTVARQQPQVEIERTIRVPGPELQQWLKTRTAIPLVEYLNHPDQRSEQRRYRYGHLFGDPASDSAIAEWQRQHPESSLSPDLVELLKTADGIHLWADLATGRSYFGILPLAEWRDAREHDAAVLFHEVPPRTSVISYHDNGDYYLLLGPEGDSFVWFDPQSPEDSKVAGDSVDQFLSWWWEYCQELDPRTDPA